MAVIKHISVKGSNGGDALNYVLYKHNEKTGELIVDGRGNPVIRDEYYLDGINCEPYSFAAECKEVNDLFGKNQLPNDIKAHHFIISYDPKDGTDHGLTGPKAQQLSMGWAERCLPGFQILVCTHMDGSNESRNIHTHIMMNSVRKNDTNPDCYGERHIDHLAGYKLHLTDDYLRYMKQELMTICEREGLYQVDLLSPANEKITDGEYRVKQHGQDRLDNLNERMAHDDLEPDKSVFQTQKQYLRDAVENVAQRATSFDEFCEIIKKDYNIEVKDSRGRISYLHPNRERYITGRALGTSYEKESLIRMLCDEREVKVSGKAERANTVPFSTETMEDCKKVFEMHTEICLVVRLQDYAKVKTSDAYANKVTLTNVKVMAETILFVQQHGFNTTDDIKDELKKMDDTIRDINKCIQECSYKINETNEQIHLLGKYLNTKETHKKFLHSDDKESFLMTHQVELEDYKETVKLLKSRYKDQFPSLKELKDQRGAQKKRMEVFKERKEKVSNYKRILKRIDSNVEMMIREDKRRNSRNDQRDVR